MKIKRYFQAVFSAFFGVQSEHNRQQDFKQNSPIGYILVGVFFVLVFVVGLIILARYVTT